MAGVPQIAFDFAALPESATLGRNRTQTVPPMILRTPQCAAHGG
jgi:hypothetical protein